MRHPAPGTSDPKRAGSRRPRFGDAARTSLGADVLCTARGRRESRSPRPPRPAWCRSKWREMAAALVLRRTGAEVAAGAGGDTETAARSSWMQVRWTAEKGLAPASASGEEEGTFILRLDPAFVSPQAFWAVTSVASGYGGTGGCGENVPPGRQSGGVKCPACTAASSLEVRELSSSPGMWPSRSGP
jgi:hypothetical protein